MIDILYIIACAVIVIGVLVVIHEGGHFLAARAFGVRVTELMIGLPGPNISVKKGETKYGITAIPLGGYAKVCGMETGDINPNIKQAIECVYSKGACSTKDIASKYDISLEDAQEALDQLVEWGTVVHDKKKHLYKTPEYSPSKEDKKFARRMCMLAPVSFPEGSPRQIDDIDEFYERELNQQYRSLSFWKKSIILLAGIAVNLLFAILAFIVIYSIIGIDVSKPDGEIVHITTDPLQAIQAGFACIAMTFQAILGLFNPQTAAETVSNSTSIVGIAVMSADYFAQGFVYALFFMAIVSVSLGLMNLLPIPPLDGGRFLIEIIQKLTRKNLSTTALGYISLAGMALFICFFIFMLNQDIQRFVLGA